MKTDLTESLASAKSAARIAQPLSGDIAVWDGGVRLCHALLAICVVIAAVLGFFGPRNALNLHLAAGLAAAALVVFRTAWGFLGTTYARFSSFVYAPDRIFARAKEILARRHTHYLGHNPLGGAMVVALLVSVSALAITGAVTLGGVDKQGPLAFATPYVLGDAFRRAHEWLAYALMLLIAWHLAGVALESVGGGEQLISAMGTGRKPLKPEAVSFAEVAARPMLASVIVGGALALVAGATLRLSNLPALGAPTAPLDPTYANECGSCHMAYPPSLAPRALWLGILAGLSDHFGEDASLDDATRTRIRAYLVVHAAETADTRAANEFRRLASDDPLRLTAAPFWRRIHAGIADSIFKSKAVGARSACSACHRDAISGRFDPQNIAIPETVRR